MIRLLTTSILFTILFMSIVANAKSSSITSPNVDKKSSSDKHVKTTSSESPDLKIITPPQSKISIDPSNILGPHVSTWTNASSAQDNATSMASRMTGTSAYGPADNFVTTWKTDNPGGSNNTSIEIPTIGGNYNYNYDVSWKNDGVWENGFTGNATHDYGTAGTYTVAIRGDFPRIVFSNWDDPKKILSIEQWGTNVWKSMAFAFRGCTYLVGNATDTPNLSQVTSMQSMFDYAENFNQDIGNWDVSNVTNMQRMFNNARSFNGNIGSWNVSNVTNMAAMFSRASTFNQNIGNWNVSKVTIMQSMFYDADKFNQNIGNWNVSKVTTMSQMFTYAENFNQDIGNWNVSNVTSMRSMFAYAENFNQYIGNWNVSNVTDMSLMFYGASTFNQNIGNWNVSKVTNMSQMFAYTENFNQDIGNWDVSKVINMQSMFNSARSFNGNIGSWNVSNVTNMVGMFAGSTFNQNIGDWNVSNVTNMRDMFLIARSFNGNIGNWDVSKVTNMQSMFANAENFNQDIGNWNVSNVFIMNNMFSGVTLSTAYYDALLNGWSQLTLQPNVNFHGGNSKYCSAQAARNTMINTFGWGILDAGSDLPLAKTKNITVTLDATGTAIITPNDIDNGSYFGCSGPTRLFISAPTFNCSNIGPNSVTLTITDAIDNQSTSTAIVTVTDNLAPIPDIANLIDITKKCEVDITDVPYPTASDNCSTTVNATTDTTFPITTVGTHIITWAYTDTAGNSATQTQQIIVLPSDLEVVTFPNSSFTYNGAVHNLEVAGLPSGASVSYNNNSQTEAGDYLVTATVSSTDTSCPDVILTATLTIEKAQAMITATSPQTYIYDGSVKNVTASLDHTEGSLNYAPQQGFTDAGTYAILVSSNETNNYLAASESVNLVITPATLSGITFNDDSFVYDENPKSLTISGTLPTGTSVSYLNNSRTEVGTQEATATISGANYNDFILTADLTITPATLSGITFNAGSFVFDSTPKSLSISGTLPTGTSVSYLNNSRTEVGTQEATATISGANYNDFILTADLTITPATLSGITFNSGSFVFDSTPKSLTISGTLPTGSNVTYLNNSRTEVGTQEVTATISGANYNDLILTADLSITPATISGITFNADSFVFDENSKSLTISGTLPTGTSVAYGNNSRTDVGTQEVTATLSGANYNDLILTADLTITPATISGITFNAGSFVFDENSKSLSISGTLPQGTSVVYTNNSRTDVGIQEVTATIAGANYNGFILTTDLTITPATISGITFNDDSFVYDKTQKSLTISGTLPTRTSVAYVNNSRTDVGDQEVTATISGANYDDFILTANLTITPATLSGITLNDDSFVFDENPKSLSISGTLPTGTSVAYTNNSRTDVGIQEVTATIAGGNYNDFILTADLTITPATLSGITFNSSSFVYDKTPKSLTVSGTFPTGTSVAYVNNSRTDVGTQEVTATLSGANYNDFILTADLTITPATLSGITFNSSSFVYDKTPKSLTVSGTFPTGTSAAYVNNSRTDVGSQEVTATVSGANYNDFILTADLTITPATLSGITFNDDRFVYDKTQKSLTISGTLPTRTSVAYVNNSRTDVGDQEVTATISGANYNDLILTANLRISPKTLMITALSNQQKIYGEGDPVFTYTLSGLEPGDAGTVISGALSRVTGEHVGVYAIQLGTLNAGDNYAIDFISADFKVLKKELVITVNPNQFKIYGSSDPLLTATYIGFANGDNETTLNGSLRRVVGEDAGMYPITLGSLNAGANYTITFNSQDFEIRKAEQTINWNQLLEFGCDNASQITLTATTNSGLPVTYSVSNASTATINDDLLTIIGLGSIQITAIQEGNQNYNPAPVLKRTVIIKKSDLIRQHWTDVLALDNSNETFVSYQWFKNGLPISGATKQYYNENAALNGSYYAEATTKTGKVITSCSLELSGLSFTQDLKIFPNPVKSGTQFTLECSFQESALLSANIQIHDLSGRILNTVLATGLRTQLTAPLQSGIYVVSLNLSNGIRKTVNLLVK